MASRSVNDPKVEKVDLVELSHRLKGLCGIFSMVEDALPDEPDLRLVFKGGIDRMRCIIEKLDSHLP